MPDHTRRDQSGADVHPWEIWLYPTFLESDRNSPVQRSLQMGQYGDSGKICLGESAGNNAGKVG